MKRKHLLKGLVICLALWLITAIHTGATKLIPGVGLVEDTRNKLILVTGTTRCPPELENSISNTNLFSPAEQKLLTDILSRLSGENNLPHKTNIMGSNGDEYDLYNSSIGKNIGFELYQMKHGVKDGLAVQIHGDRCVDWKHYSNGMTVDKWLVWTGDGVLLKYVKFKEPYDFHKYNHWKFKFWLTLPWPWNDKPLLTTTWP